MWPGVLFLVWLNTFAKLLLELHAPPPFLMRSCTIWWLVSLCSTCNTTKLLYARRTQVEDLLTSFLKIFHSNMNPPPPFFYTPLSYSVASTPTTGLTFEEVSVWTECQHRKTGGHSPQRYCTHQDKHHTQKEGHTGERDVDIISKAPCILWCNY